MAMTAELWQMYVEDLEVDDYDDDGLIWREDLAFVVIDLGLVRTYNRRRPPIARVLAASARSRNWRHSRRVVRRMLFRK